MRTFILFIVLGLSTSCQSQDNFDWLLGNWKNLKNGSVEQWWKEGENYKGRVYKLQDNDTLITEKLNILFEGENSFYQADVDHNPEPTLFKMIVTEKDHFICKNPTHDFPKQIEYSYDGKLLTVIISDGGDKQMGFQFKKVE